MAMLRYRTTDAGSIQYRSRDMATQDRALTVAEMIEQDEQDWPELRAMRLLDGKAV
jgi:hypothetical protein